MELLEDVFDQDGHMADKIALGKDLVAEHGLTVIMNTHYPAHALRVADQVLMISAAHRAVVGPTGEVMNERTLAEVFGVDVRIGELEHNGTTVETVVPVSLSGKWDPPSE